MNEITPQDGPLTLRLGKASEKTGMGRKKVFGANRTAPLKHSSDKNLRGREEKVLRILKELLVQETHHATGKSIRYLNSLDLDHIHGRHASGFDPLGAIFDPLNLQLLEREIHSEKTNALTREGQRLDLRGTIEQEVALNLRKKLLEKVGRVFTLEELRAAIESLIYHEASGCQICGGQEDHIDEGEEPTE